MFGSNLSRYMQPINFISEYYGEKYGFYFAYLAYYTAMLVPIAIIGVIFFILQLRDYFQNEEAQAEGIKRSLDWRYNFVYSLIVSIWATLMVEGWIRTQARIGNAWLMRDFKDPTTELPTFKCSYGVDKNLKSPWKYKKINSYGRMLCIGVPITLLFLSFVFATQILTRSVYLSYKDKTPEELAEQINVPFSQYFKFWPAMVNTAALIVFETIYKRVAVKLVLVENHRTEEEFEASLSLKISLFQFFNCYLSSFLIAFWYKDFA